MTDIWQFALQTFSVSLVAAFLIILKTIFKDKLPPRWQYGVWGILALRILIPVRCERFVLLPLGIYVEALKSVVEKGLNSAFADPYTVTEPTNIFPYITDKPQSITDIIFVIYIAGLVLSLCSYIFSYIRLRLAIKNGTEATAEETSRIKAIFDSNKVKFVKVVYTESITGAFICGVLKPVLVLPASRQTDEKIILHEIMHIKHKDSLQSIFWCVMRCLHWCNPFMHYVFNVIGNDMESLCDQRVLERLEGEERREYGVLLLNEVNNKYARLPGTTSVSNGGKNISQRIEAIVRFKKYPPKMALAGICIIIVAAVPCLFVSAGSSSNNYYPSNSIEIEKSLAFARTYRCTTVAGAIDTYAKGLINQNAIMILTASPSDRHEEIIREFDETVFYNSGFTAVASSDTKPFTVFNLSKTDKYRYSALLVCSTAEDDTDISKTENENEFRIYGDSIIIPIEIFKEKNNWVVRESGERIKTSNHLDEFIYQQAYSIGEALPPLFESTQMGENGSLKTTHITTYTLNSDDYNSLDPLFSSSMSKASYDNTIHLDAEFDMCLAETTFTYTYNGEDYKDVKHIRAEYTRDINKAFPKSKKGDSTFSASSSTDGSGTISNSVNIGEVWDRTVESSCHNSNLDPEDMAESYRPAFKYAVYIDGVLADEFVQEVG